MVGCNSYRNPALLAKITSTIDVISGGRLDWGIGAGWYELEYRGYGYPFPKPKDRIGMLRETVEIVTSMWREPETTYKGEYYEVSRANCDPKPLQDPHPPIWIGGGGEQLTLRVVARYADCSNFGGQARAVGPQARRPAGPLRRRRARPRRDPHDVVARGVHPRDRGGGARRRQRAACGASRSRAGGPGNLVGTPEQVAEKVQAYVDLGCRGFIPWCADYPDTETLTVRQGGHARVPDVIRR